MEQAITLLNDIAKTLPILCDNLQELTIATVDAVIDKIDAIKRREANLYSECKEVCHHLLSIVRQAYSFLDKIDDFFCYGQNMR